MKLLRNLAAGLILAFWLMLVSACSVRVSTPLATAVPEGTIWLSRELSMTPAAWRLADSVYHAGWREVKEHALCVGKDYTIKPDGTVVVQRLTLPVRTMYADSVNVAYECPMGPTLHTHLIENGWRYTFSPLDSANAVGEKYPTIPFYILMSDSHAFSVLWRKEPHDHR